MIDVATLKRATVNFQKLTAITADQVQFELREMEYHASNTMEYDDAVYHAVKYQHEAAYYGREARAHLFELLRRQKEG
jgi:hypothetical protein